MIDGKQIQLYFKTLGIEYCTKINQKINDKYKKPHKKRK